MREKVELIASLETCLDILFDVMNEDALDSEKKQLEKVRETLGLMVVSRRKLRKSQRKLDLDFEEVEHWTNN
jgi:hypothetical protein